MRVNRRKGTRDQFNGILLNKRDNQWPSSVEIGFGLTNRNRLSSNLTVSCCRKKNK